MTLLRAALREAGCSPVPIEARALSARTGATPSIAAEAGALDDLDALLVRFLPHGSLEQVVFRVDALHVLADAGLPVINTPRAIERTVDKHWTSQILSRAGVLTPRTVAAERAADALRAFEAMGDVLVKPLFGSGGRGIERVREAAAARRLFAAMETRGAVYYVQEFVPHGLSDLRLFVVDGSVAAAARRVGDGWKTNVAQGARVLAHRARPEEEDLAIRACRAVGADYAGVDLLEAEDGRLLVAEVNGIPGWSGVQGTTTVDIAAAIARLARARAEACPRGSPARPGPPPHEAATPR